MQPNCLTPDILLWRVSSHFFAASVLGHDRQGDERNADSTADDGWGDAPTTAAARPARSAEELQGVLQRIDGGQYPKYHDIEGAWQYPGGFRLVIDRTQARVGCQI